MVEVVEAVDLDARRFEDLPRAIGMGAGAKPRIGNEERAPEAEFFGDASKPLDGARAENDARARGKIDESVGLSGQRDEGSTL